LAPVLERKQSKEDHSSGLGTWSVDPEEPALFLRMIVVFQAVLLCHG
jgi:hypothetical protein